MLTDVAVGAARAFVPSWAPKESVAHGIEVLGKDSVKASAAVLGVGKELEMGWKKESTESFVTARQ